MEVFLSPCQDLFSAIFDASGLVKLSPNNEHTGALHCSYPRSTRDIQITSKGSLGNTGRTMTLAIAHHFSATLLLFLLVLANYLDTCLT